MVRFLFMTFKSIEHFGWARWLIGPKNYMISKFIFSNTWCVPFRNNIPISHLPRTHIFCRPQIAVINLLHVKHLYILAISHFRAYRKHQWPFSEPLFSYISIQIQYRLKLSLLMTHTSMIVKTSKSSYIPTINTNKYLNVNYIFRLL